MSVENQNKSVGILLVLIAGASWGVMGIFVRELVKLGLDSVDIAALRAMGSALILVSTFAVSHREAFRMKFKDIWCVAGCGILSITLFNICYFKALRYTTVNIAVVLLYTSPAFVMLMSVLCFKEKLTVRKVVSLITVLLGCVLVSGVFSSGGKISPLVLFLGIGSGFCYALYTIFGRFAMLRGYSGAAITLWTFIFAGSTGMFLLDWQRMSQTAAMHPWQFAGLTLGLVLVVTILPYCTYIAGLKRLTPSTSAITATVEPLVGTLCGVIVFHETLTISAIAGMVLILGAVLLCRE